MSPAHPTPEAAAQAAEVLGINLHGDAYLTRQAVARIQAFTALLWSALCSEEERLAEGQPPREWP
jgi:hypothetical protein